MKSTDILRCATITVLLSLFCPAVTLALSFTVFDDFDDGDYDGWTVLNPASPPLLYVSPEGFAVGGAGPEPAGITHPLNVVSATELSLGMCATAGPDVLSSLFAWGKSEDPAGQYYEGCSCNGSAVFSLRDADGIEQVFTYGDGSLTGWHTFEWTRNAEGWWSFYLDGQNVDPDFVQDNRLASFVSADLHASDAQSQVEWVQVTAATAAPGRGLAIEPNTLNLKSEGRWITCYIELGESYSVRDIDVNTVTLNGEVLAELWPTATGDHDGDGVASLMVKFDRAAVQEILEVGDAVIITVTGVLTDGVLFSDSDVIRVIDPGRGGKPEDKPGQHGKPETNPGLDGKPDGHPGNHGKPETNPGKGKEE